MASDNRTTDDTIGEKPDPGFEPPLWGYYGFEQAVNVFRSLMTEVGTNRVLEACKSYGRIWGMQLANMAKQRFGLTKGELEDVALPAYWAHCATSAGYIKPLEIREGGAVVELYSCATPFVDAPPEICIATSHNYAEGVCQVVNPEYEAIFTHHLANKDDRCRYIVKKKSSKLDLENLGVLQKTIPLTLSQEETLKLVMHVCIGSLVNFTSVSVELVGSERTLELVLPQAKDLGVKLGKSLMSGSGGKDNIQTIKDQLDFLSLIQAQTGTPIRATVSGMEREIKDCPFKGAPSEVCKQLEAISNGVCEAINPNYEFAYDRMMSEGDSSCHWTVRKKAKEEPKEEARKMVRI